MHLALGDPLITFEIGGLELLPRVRPMWEKLNLGNVRLSPDFSKYFESRGFEDRMAPIADRAIDGHVIIIVAKDKASETDIGYMAGSIDTNGTAELDSLYVEDGYRNRGIGSRFIDQFLGWTRSFPVKKVIVQVTWGNEDSPRLYERYGFRRRATTFELPPK